MTSPTHVDFDFQPADLAAWWLFSTRRHRTGRLLPWFAGLTLAFLGMAAANHYSLRLEAVVAIGFLALGAGLFGVPRLARSGTTAWSDDQAKSSAGATQFGSYSLTLDIEGVAEKAPNGTHRHTWGAVEELCETTTHFFIVTAGTGAYVVPKRVFAGEGEAASFWSTAKSLKAGS